MFCTGCGKELPDGIKHCPNCGKMISNNSVNDNTDNNHNTENNANNDINFSDVASFAGEKVNKAMEEAKAQVNASKAAYKKQMEDSRIKNVSDIIVDPQEKNVAVIGSSYLDSMIHGGGLKKGFGILTDRRFYFKGKCFTKILGHRNLIEEEYTVDLENVTATGFVYNKRYMLLILGIILFIVSLFIGEPKAILGGLILLIAFLVGYFLTKKVYYEVHFEGGMISIDVSKYGGIKEVREFNKLLCLEKDKCKK